MMYLTIVVCPQDVLVAVPIKVARVYPPGVRVAANRGGTPARAGAIQVLAPDHCGAIVTRRDYVIVAIGINVRSVHHNRIVAV